MWWPKSTDQVMIYGSREWNEKFEQARLSYESAIVGMENIYRAKGGSLKFWSNRDLGDESNQDMIARV